MDVRIIAATNRDLAEEVRNGLFREDIYFRLKQIRIEIPPLRERVSDIVPLALHFVEKHAKKNGRKVRRIEPEVLDLFRAYHGGRCIRTHPVRPRNPGPEGSHDF